MLLQKGRVIILKILISKLCRYSKKSSLIPFTAKQTTRAMPKSFAKPAEIKSSRMKSNTKARTDTIGKSTNTNQKPCITSGKQEQFVAAEKFDFNQPIASPYLQSPSMAGPMTR